MQIELDESQAEILIRLISGQTINGQERREILNIEDELIENLSIKRFGLDGHLYACRYKGVVPASQCPCDCGERKFISENIEKIKSRKP